MDFEDSRRWTTNCSSLGKPGNSYLAIHLITQSCLGCAAVLRIQRAVPYVFKPSGSAGGSLSLGRAWMSFFKRRQMPMHDRMLSMRRTRRPIVADLKRRVTPRMFYGRVMNDLPLPRTSYAWTSGGLCPFHPDRRVGNFRINLNTGGFTCFSCQASGGDIIDFVQLQLGCTFSKALEHLMREFGVRL